jgi:hypothetical protein
VKRIPIDARGLYLVNFRQAQDYLSARQPHTLLLHPPPIRSHPRRKRIRGIPARRHSSCRRNRFRHHGRPAHSACREFPPRRRSCQRAR